MEITDTLGRTWFCNLGMWDLCISDNLEFIKKSSPYPCLVSITDSFSVLIGVWCPEAIFETRDPLNQSFLTLINAVTSETHCWCCVCDTCWTFHPLNSWQAAFIFHCPAWVVCLYLLLEACFRHFSGPGDVNIIPFILSLGANMKSQCILPLFTLIWLKRQYLPNTENCEI